MFRRIGHGIELMKQSFQVLRLDKELLLFPLLSAIASLLVIASFAVPIWTSGYFTEVSEDGQMGLLGYALVFAFYIANYFVMIFFNTAIVECAIIRFRGGDPTMADGLKGAASRLPQIFGWAVVSATVGMLLRALTERAGVIGKIVVGIMGLAWSATTFFVIPVIVMERLGPIAAVKRSTEIVRQTWAEALAAHTGIGLIAGLCSFLAIVVSGIGGVTLASGNTALGAILLGTGVMSLILITLCASTLQAIITGAIYMYAGQGEVPEQFDRDTLDRVFAK